MRHIYNLLIFYNILYLFSNVSQHFSHHIYNNVTTYCKFLLHFTTLRHSIFPVWLTVYVNFTSEKKRRVINNEQSRDTDNNWNTRHRTKTNKARRKHNTAQKTKIISNTDPAKKTGWAHVLAKGMQFLPVLTHPTSYLYNNQDVLHTTIYTKKHK